MKSAVLLVLVACSGAATHPSPPESPTVPAPRASHAPTLIAAPLPGDPTRTTIHRLSNGMTVYLSPDPQAPTVAAHVVVRAGSSQDPHESTGLAHYLEHMLLFKGTRRLGTLDYDHEKPHLDRIAALYAELRRPDADRERILAEIDHETQLSSAYTIANEGYQTYARMGITDHDAWTSYDATGYHAVVPKNRLAQWARMEAERFRDPVFRLFWTELEVVYEEKNRGADSAERRVDEAMMKALFPSWTPVLGEIEHLKTPAYQDMVAFYERYYTPANMAIVLAGDVDASVLPTLEREFGAFTRPAGAAAGPGLVPGVHGRTEVTVQVPEDGLVLAWPLVSATHRDRAALDLLDLLLYDGRSGILGRDLLIAQKVADARATAEFQRDVGYYVLSADALEGQTHAELEQLLRGVVGKLQRGDFTDADIAAAILTAEIAAERVVESNDGRAELVENAFVLGQDWHDVAARFERMKQLTRADVVRVAQRYLGDDVAVVKKVKGVPAAPKITKPKITPVKLDPERRSAFARAVLDMPVTPIEPAAVVAGRDYERATLPTGDLVVVPNTRDRLFALTYSYDFGAADDRLACFAVEALKVAGTATRSADDVTRRLHELGLAIDASCSSHRLAIELSGIDRNLAEGVALLRELLAKPVLAADVVQAHVATVLAERANQLSSPQDIAHAQREVARHGEDSAFRVVPANAQLHAVTAAQLARVFARLTAMRHRTAYFGPRRAADVAPTIALGDGKLAAPPPRSSRFRTASGVFATAQDTAQTQLWLVWPLAPADDVDARAACELATSYIGYTGKLLFHEVREARGLAYIVYGGCEPGERRGEPAFAYAYAGTQADKANDTLDAILGTLARPVEDTRLALAKDALAQAHRFERIEPRWLAAAVYAWDDQGERGDPRAARIARVLATDKAALERWMRAALAGPRLVSVTGPRERLDERRLGKLGPVAWIPPAELFGY